MGITKRLLYLTKTKLKHFRLLKNIKRLKLIIEFGKPDQLIRTHETIIAQIQTNEEGVGHQRRR